MRAFDQPSGKPLQVLRGVSFSIAPHQMVALMGPNGCGKTTLLNIIAGDLQADSGTVRLEGRQILELSTNRRAQFIGRVHQDSYKALASELTVGELVAVANRRRHGLSLRLPQARAAISFIETMSQAVAAFVAEREQMTAEHLSGGQRQLLSLVVATLGEPTILLLDEHRASLDEQYKSIADDLLGQFLQMRPSAAIVATHDEEWCGRTALHWLALCLGRSIWIP